MAVYVNIMKWDYVLHDGLAITPLGVLEGVPRTYSELKDVMMRDSDEEGIAYWMFRNSLPSEVGMLRGDVTLIYPGTLPSGELIKTHGHYHPEGPWGVWPELYGVAKGSSLFILQNVEGEVKLVRVNEGELIMIPPGYGHVTVNVGEEELVTFNYVSPLFKSIYDPYKEKRGAAVYVLKDRKGIKVVRNPNYDVERVKLCKPLPLWLKEPILHLAYKPHEEEWFKCYDERELPFYI